MKTDATKTGASAATDVADPTKNVDNAATTTDTEGAQVHPVKERQHPFSQREAVNERFAKFREEHVAEAKEQGSLVEEAEEVEEEAAAPPAETPAPPTPEDPLAKVIVRKDEGVFFKAVVDGKEVLVPIERAQAQLQKHEAAELRLQRATERSRELDAREAEIAKREKAPAPRPPSDQDVSGETDAALEAEAADLVKSLIEDDETEAAKKLASALKKARATGSTIDKEALASETAKLVKEQQAKEAENAALMEGYNAYLKEYGETIHQKPELRAYHSAKVDALALEHPEWTFKQCALEAGKQTEKFAGIVREPQATDPKGEQPAASLAETRQQRKQGLQPVPPNKSTARGTDKPTQPDNSPQAVVNEMRKARGQPVRSTQRAG